MTLLPLLQSDCLDGYLKFGQPLNLPALSLARKAIQLACYALQVKRLPALSPARKAIQVPKVCMALQESLVTCFPFERPENFIPVGFFFTQLACYAFKSSVAFKSACPISCKRKAIQVPKVGRALQESLVTCFPCELPENDVPVDFFGRLGHIVDEDADLVALDPAPAPVPLVEEPIDSTMANETTVPVIDATVQQVPPHEDAPTSQPWCPHVDILGCCAWNRCPLVDDLREEKQAPLYGLQQAGTAWQAVMIKQLTRLSFMANYRRIADAVQNDDDDEYDDRMPGLLTRDDARVSIYDSDDVDMPDLASTETEAMSDSDNEDGQPTAADGRWTPATHTDVYSEGSTANDAVVLIAFSPKTLEEVDNLLVDVPINPTATTQGEQSSYTVPRQDPWYPDASLQAIIPTLLWLENYNREEVYVEGKEPPIPRSAIETPLNRHRRCDKCQWWMTRYEIHESGPIVTVPQLPPKYKLGALQIIYRRLSGFGMYKATMQRHIVEDEAPSEIPLDETDDVPLDLNAPYNPLDSVPMSGRRKKGATYGYPWNANWKNSRGSQREVRRVDTRLRRKREPATLDVRRPPTRPTEQTDKKGDDSAETTDEPHDDVAEYEIGVGTSFDASSTPLALVRKQERISTATSLWVMTTTTTTTTTTTQKKADPNVMAARKNEIDGLYKATCVRWASRDDARRVNITPPLRDDDACCASLDALIALCRHGRSGTATRGKDKNFPPSFVRSSKSIPWYDNLKRKLDEHGFRYKALGDAPDIAYAMVGRIYRHLREERGLRLRQLSLHAPQVRGKRVAVRYIPSNDNLADAFTKPLPTPQFRALVDQFTVRLDDYLKDDEDSIPPTGPTAAPYPPVKKKKSDNEQLIWGYKRYESDFDYSFNWGGLRLNVIELGVDLHSASALC
eukprot:g4173.t1